MSRTKQDAAGGATLKATEQGIKATTNARVDQGGGPERIKRAYERAFGRLFPQARHPGMYPLRWGRVEWAMARQVHEAIGKDGPRLVGLLVEYLERYDYIRDGKRSGVWGMPKTPTFRAFVEHFDAIRAAFDADGAGESLASAMEQSEIVRKIFGRRGA